MEMKTQKQVWQFNKAYADIVSGIRSYHLWSYLGWMDIKQRYRGSLLGPIWITLSMIIFISALSIVYGRLFHQPLRTILPYMTCGLLVWTYLTTVITEGCDVFVASKDFIENSQQPYLIYIMKLIWRNIIIFAHNSVVYLLVLIFFDIPITLSTLFIIPGFILVTVNLIGITMTLGLLGARFRDLPPVIVSVITVAFFVSPVTWQPKLIGEASLIIRLNPFSYYLNLLRAPLLGHAPNESSLIFGSVVGLLLLLTSFLLFSRFRTKVPYWL